MRRKMMWYFNWILGVLLACSFGIINAMWLENTMNDAQAVDDPTATDRPASE
jgi:cyd operon protein YbgT